MDDILFYSFYTDDEYYRGKKDELEGNLKLLSIPYEIDVLTIQKGMAWIDICRKKIGMINSICKKHPTKKIFWIDVDCQISHLPEYISNFSSDVIGFSRGFSSPMRMGYHLRSRFWEPCFIGINTSKRARHFMNDAELFELDFDGPATDDYFFEESWRKNCDSMSYQIIPANERNTEYDHSGFFSFGASGNVDEFKGTAIQHEKLFSNNITTTKDRLIKVLSRTGLLNTAIKIKHIFNKPPPMHKIVERLSSKNFKTGLIRNAIKNEPKKVNYLKLKNVNMDPHEKEKVIKLADSILEYQNIYKDKSSLPVCWWFNPAPGNFGDWLSPYIISKLTGHNVNLVTPNSMKNFKQPNIVSVGSIGKFANDFSIVIGSGVSRKDTTLNKNAKYLSLRGPLTGEVLEASGGIDPKIYGDPAIIMPQIFKCERVNNGRTAFVRHFSHLELDIKLTDEIDEISILISSCLDIENFIFTLNQYDRVITSAMHCYIICQSYGIPCALVSWDEGAPKVAGDGMKYLDYALGVGVKPVAPVSISRELCDFDFDNFISNERVSIEKIDEMYAYLSDKLTHLNL